MDLDWRDLDPFLRQLQDCAAFWTIINLSADVMYSTLLILLIFLEPNPESAFFQGLQSHVNPVLLYLIPSLLINYGGVMSNQINHERAFLVFSILKGILFPLPLTCFLYLTLSDVREYFGEFWVSFVVLLGCYDGIGILALWSMYVCNKYIYINEAAQKRLRQLIERKNILQSDFLKNQRMVCECDECQQQEQENTGEEEFMYSSVWTIDSHSLYQGEADISEEIDTVSVNNHFQRVFLGSIDQISNVQITL